LARNRPSSAKVSARRFSAASWKSACTSSASATRTPAEGLARISPSSSAVANIALTGAMAFRIVPWEIGRGFLPGVFCSANHSANARTSRGSISPTFRRRILSK
jgi:hypothetical protein